MSDERFRYRSPSPIDPEKPYREDGGWWWCAAAGRHMPPWATPEIREQIDTNALKH